MFGTAWNREYNPTDHESRRHVPPLHGSVPLGPWPMERGICTAQI